MIRIRQPRSEVSGRRPRGMFRTGRFPALSAAVSWLVLCSISTLADEPFFEQVPHDRITLDEENQFMVLEVEPLDLPDRQLPNPFPESGKIVVRPIDKPDSPYEIQWSAIAKIELFEQMVLVGANRLVRRGRLGEAYEYFMFLHENYPKLSGLDTSIENYFFREAKALERDGQYEAALARLRELHQRNPKFPELKEALGLATEKLVEQRVADDDYWAARILIRNLAALSPEQETVQKWQRHFQGQAGDLLVEARQAMEAGRLREAHKAGRRMTLIWPDLPGAREVMESIHRQYPRVVVGVTLPAAVHEPGRLDDWASRRSCRLVYRTLMEFVGPSTEGGKYFCPLGEMKTEDLGLRLAFKIRPDLQWSSGDTNLTGYDLARRLLAMADSHQDAYRDQWAGLLAGVSVRNVYEVEAELQRPVVRPQALLQVTIAPDTSLGTTAQSHPPNGPYMIDSQTEDETVYLANPQYFAAGATRVKEIVERYYRLGTGAVAALERRQIEVLDRVNPWDVERLSSSPELVVKPYTVPTVHCLIPNMRKPLTSQRGFRRALVYGIHRQSILNRLLGGEEQVGCQVISGPFSPGIGINHPLDYAYDESIEPRPYEPQLAIALAEMALKELIAAEEKDEEPKAVAELVLAYPPHDVARLATAAIQRHLKLVGIPIRLEELKPGTPPQIPDSVDLLYAELAMWEPVVDAGRLLDQDGPSGGASPHMSLALRQLEQAADWPEVGRRLRQIHRLAHDEVAVVPLWQLTEHFACHRSLEGVSPEPVLLYQDVENWQLSFYYPAEGQ